LSGEHEGEEDFTGTPHVPSRTSGGPTFPGRPTSAVPPQTEPHRGSIGNKPNVTSAPTSPTRTGPTTSTSSGVSSFLSRATSITSSVRDVTSNVTSVAGQIKDRIKDTPSRSRILLVVDDNQTDWCVVFTINLLVDFKPVLIASDLCLRLLSFHLFPV